MKTFLILSTLLWLMLNTVYAQIDKSIPTPPDLQAQEPGITILTKHKLDDGTIVIRYVNKKGRTMQRRTLPTKPGEKENIVEWDEANPMPDDAKSKAGIGIGAGPIVPEGLKGAAGGLQGGVPIAGGTLPDKPKPDQPASALDDVKKGAEGITPDNPKPAEPTSALDEAAKGAKKIVDDIVKAISNLFVVKATGTGQTIGVIASITLKNNNNFPVEILPQTFYIPSDGKYQNYVGRIPEGITIPPNGTVDVPVNGICADVHTPPVPPGEVMPPVSTWIPVGGSPLSGVIVSEHPGESASPDDTTLIPIVNTVPVPDFNPSDIPHIITTSGYKPVDTPDTDIIITWTGTDIPVAGTLDPVANPKVFALVIVSVLEAIEDAVEVVQKGSIFPTPFSNDSIKEREAIIQQTFWIVNAIITGKKYDKDDFTENTYGQFQNTTGRTVASIPPEQKEKVDSGIDDFWNAFQASGIVAKVISAESPGIDIGISSTAVQAGQADYADNDKDDVADQTSEEEEEFKCVCPDSIKFNLEVKRGETVVFESGKVILASSNGFESPLEKEVKIEKLMFGDTLDITVSNIDMNCLCAMTSCDVVNVNFLTSHLGNNNCEEIDNLDNTIKMKIAPKNAKDKSIYNRFFIAAKCTSEFCNTAECKYYIKLTFIDSKSKKK